MNVSILSPETEIFHGAAKSVKVPGSLGQFQVLQNHAPIVSSLQSGEIVIEAASGKHRYYDEESGTLVSGLEPGNVVTFKIDAGFIEVMNNEVSILVQSAR